MRRAAVLLGLVLIPSLLAHARPAAAQPTSQASRVSPASSASQALPTLPTLPPGVSLDRPLTADDAVAIALVNNAQLQADRATLGLARADLREAGLLRNPRLDMLLPVGLKPFELLVTMPVDALWQRPRRVDAAKRALELTAERLLQNGLDTARDARVAHADLLLARDRFATATEAANLRARIATLTEARLRAGDIGELDAVAARAAAGAAQEQLARVEQEVALAAGRLRFALGLGLARPLSALDVSAAALPLTAPPPMEALLDSALAARPDLKAAEMAVSAAMARAGWERTRRLTLAAQLSSKEVGTNGVLTGPGLSVDLPIFNRNQGLVARADAEVELAARQYAALKQRVALDVADARTQLAQAQQVLARLREAVLPPLERAAALADHQYRQGDVAYLFVLEQTRDLVDTRLRVADAEAAVRRASAQLERSLGTR